MEWGGNERYPPPVVEKGQSISRAGEAEGLVV